jgi:outer membrane protein OmpA-like peptidoglycan-associated protein
MRKLAVALLAGGLMAAPAALPAQQAQAPQTADDYVCQLSGNCGDQAQSDDQADQATPSGRPRISATRGFSLARPNAMAVTPSGGSRSQAPRPPRQVARRPVTGRPAGRVDLRVDFALGSAVLSAAQQDRMRTFADALKRPQLSGMRFRIEGHTDSIGSRASNMALSRARAQAVADFLTSQGVPASRLDVRGYGYDRPLPGHRASDPSNRRVEAVRTS